MEIIRTQPGPQTDFLASRADIAIYGGAAGGGKTYALMLEPLKRRNVPDFGAVIFRRTGTEIRSQGGLWDESVKIYPKVGGWPTRHRMEWTWENGFKVRMRHLEDDTAIRHQQGAQIPLICFDELTHFTRYQFFFMLSRNRSMTGMPGRIRATTNPDVGSWVADFVEWWIDQDTGYAIKERAGLIRWMAVSGDTLVWADTREEIERQYGDNRAMSVTFIPARVFDNKKLLDRDPSYLARLNSLPYVERMRFLEGNWKVRAQGGTLFRREWFPVVEAAPESCVAVRYWDRAATKPHPGNPDPDWTAGVKVAKDKEGRFYVMNVIRLRDTPSKVEEAIRNMAAQDGPRCVQWLEQDPGQAGKAEISYYVRSMAGVNMRVSKVEGNKETRALPVSAQAEQGNVHLVRGPWNDDFLAELENFPGGPHDDQVDGLSGGFNVLANARKIMVA